MLGASQNCITDKNGMFLGYWWTIRKGEVGFQALTDRIDKGGMYVPDICLRRLYMESEGERIV